MSFSTLRADVTKFRQLEPNYFTASQFNDSELQALKLELAQSKFKNDCYDIFEYWDNTSASTDLDSLVTAYEVQFQDALMYLQAHYEFQGFTDNKETSEYYKGVYFLDKYKELIGKFYNFELGNRKFSKVRTFKIG